MGNNIDYVKLITGASELTIKESLSRSIVNFGSWAMDANKNPIVFQVQVLVQEVGGSETRKDNHFYFIPTTQPAQALAIAKAMATYDFLNLEYPQIEEVKNHEQPAEVKNEVSEEVRPEAQVPESKEQSTGKKSRKPRTPKATTEETVEVVEVAPAFLEQVTLAAEYEPYDRTNVKHKDAYILLLDTINPNWREMGKEASVQLSTNMVGKPFLMGTEVNSNFKSEVESYVQAKLSK
jgi:hypothetical protein